MDRQDVNLRIISHNILYPNPHAEPLNSSRAGDKTHYEFEYLKDASQIKVESLLSSVRLELPQHNLTNENSSHVRTLLDQKSSKKTPSETKNFLLTNRKNAANPSLKKRRSPERDRNKVLEGFELKVPESSITKNIKQVIDLKKSNELKKMEFHNYDPNNKEFQCMACLKRHRRHRNCRSVEVRGNSEKKSRLNRLDFAVMPCRTLFIKGPERRSELDNLKALFIGVSEEIQTILRSRNLSFFRDLKVFLLEMKDEGRFKESLAKVQGFTEKELETVILSNEKLAEFLDSLNFFSLPEGSSYLSSLLQSKTELELISEELNRVKKLNAEMKEKVSILQGENERGEGGKGLKKTVQKIITLEKSIERLEEKEENFKKQICLLKAENIKLFEKNRDYREKLMNPTEITEKTPQVFDWKDKLSHKSRGEMIKKETQTQTLNNENPSRDLRNSEFVVAQPEAYQEEIQRLRKEAEGLLSQNQYLSQENSRLRNIPQSSSFRVNSGLEIQVKAYQEEIDRLQDETNRLISQNQHLAAENQDLLRSLAQTSHSSKMTELEIQVRVYQEEIERLREETAKLISQKQHLSVENNELRNSFHQNSQVSKSPEPETQETERLRSEIAKLLAQNQLLSQANKAKSLEITEFRSLQASGQISATLGDRYPEKLNDNLKGSNYAKPLSQPDNSRFSGEYFQAMSELSECKNQVESLKMAIRQKEAEAERLKDQLASQTERLSAEFKELESANQLIAHLGAVINGKTDEISRYKISVEEINTQFMVLKQELISSKQMVAELENQLAFERLNRMSPENANRSEKLPAERNLLDFNRQSLLDETSGEKAHQENFARMAQNYEAVVKELEERIYYMNFQLKEKTEKLLSTLRIALILSNSLLYLIDLLRSADPNLIQKVRENLESQEASILRTNGELSKDMQFFEVELSKFESVPDRGNALLRESDFVKLEKYELLKKLNENLKLELSQMKERITSEEVSKMKSGQVKSASLKDQLDECLKKNGELMTYIKHLEGKIYNNGLRYRLEDASLSELRDPDREKGCLSTENQNLVGLVYMQATTLEEMY